MFRHGRIQADPRLNNHGMELYTPQAAFDRPVWDHGRGSPQAAGAVLAHRWQHHDLTVPDPTAQLQCTVSSTGRGSESDEESCACGFHHGVGRRESHNGTVQHGRQQQVRRGSLQPPERVQTVLHRHSA